MSITKVAGTIMLNEGNGTKKFLVEKSKESYQLIVSEMSTDKTGLASILATFKEDVTIDVEKISLVDLTNAQIKQKQIPFFVFEMNQNSQIKIKNDRYSWETPSTLRSVLQDIEITGVPYF